MNKSKLTFAALMAAGIACSPTGDRERGLGEEQLPIDAGSKMYVPPSGGPQLDGSCPEGMMMARLVEVRVDEEGEGEPVTIVQRCIQPPNFTDAAPAPPPPPDCKEVVVPDARQEPDTARDTSNVPDMMPDTQEPDMSPPDVLVQKPDTSAPDTSPDLQPDAGIDTKPDGPPPIECVVDEIEDCAPPFSSGDGQTCISRRACQYNHWLPCTVTCQPGSTPPPPVMDPPKVVVHVCDEGETSNDCETKTQSGYNCNGIKTCTMNSWSGCVYTADQCTKLPPPHCGGASTQRDASAPS